MTVHLASWQVWWADFDPQVGREQAGVRPAIVVGTALACQLPNQLAIVVPVTTKDRGLPFHPRIELARPSFAMCDQVKSISVNRLTRLHASQLTDDDISSVQFALRQMVSVG